MQKKCRYILSGLLIVAFFSLSGFGYGQNTLCKSVVRTAEIVAPKQVPAEDITPEWTLILVNANHPLMAEYQFPQGKVAGYVFDQRAADDLQAMIDAAKNDGVELLLCSGYRSIEKQTYLFNRKIKQYEAAGYNYEDAYNIAKTVVAIPGTSEHHTGLAVDIVTVGYQQLNSGFENTKAFAWLKENCTKYGFIMRYPEDKKEITGIIYEPWHYRYVGNQAAVKITENNWCFEEYVDYLNAEYEKKLSEKAEELFAESIPATEEITPVAEEINPAV